MRICKCGHDKFEHDGDMCDGKCLVLLIEDESRYCDCKEYEDQDEKANI